MTNPAVPSQSPRPHRPVLAAPGTQASAHFLDLLRFLWSATATTFLRFVRPQLATIHLTRVELHAHVLVAGQLEQAVCIVKAGSIQSGWLWVRGWIVVGWPLRMCNISRSCGSGNRAVHRHSL